MTNLAYLFLGFIFGLSVASVFWVLVWVEAAKIERRRRDRKRAEFTGIIAQMEDEFNKSLGQQ